MATKIKGGGARKYDRNRVSCKSYRDAGKAEKSKAMRLLKHIARCPWDACARSAFDRLPVTAKGKATLPQATKSPSRLRAEAGTTLTKLHRASLAA